MTLEQLSGILLNHIADTSIHSGEGGGGGTTPPPQDPDEDVSAILEKWSDVCETIVANLTHDPDYYGSINISGITTDNALNKYMTIVHNAIGIALSQEPGLNEDEVNDLIEEYLTNNTAIILADYIKVNDIVAGTATVTELFSACATFFAAISDSLTASDIAAFTITSDHMSIADAFITNAMVQNISANKINTGTINANNVTISGDNGKMLIADGTITISDGVHVRVQIGADANDDYNLVVADEDGNVMWSALGISRAAIKSAIIDNDAISPNANISASKINISSLISTLNSSGGLSMNATQIVIDANNQKLSAWLSTMNTWKGSIGDRTDTLETSVELIQGQLSTFASQTEVTELSTGYTNLNTNLTSLTQTVNSLSSTVSSINRTVQSMEGQEEAITSLEQDIATLEQTASSLSATLSTLRTTVTGLSSTVSGHGNSITNLQSADAALSASATSLSARLTTVESRTYTDTSTVEEMIESHAATIEATAEQLRLEFGRTQEDLDNAYVSKDDLNQWITIDTSGLTLGSSDSDILLNINNNSVRFFNSNGNDVAEWTGTEFHAPNFTVDADEYLKLGNYKFIPKSDGSLIMRYESD